MIMTAMALYKLLNENDIEFDLVEIFEGVRILRVIVEDLENENFNDEETKNA